MVNIPRERALPLRSLLTSPGKVKHSVLRRQKKEGEIKVDDTDRISYVHVCCSDQCSPSHLHDVYIVLTEEDRPETKGEEGEGRGKENWRRRRRNSLVKEFKWNDEKKLEGRTG